MISYIVEENVIKDAGKWERKKLLLPSYISSKAIFELTRGNMNTTIFESFVTNLTSNVVEDKFYGIYERIDIKFLSLLTYCFGTLGILGILLVVKFERSGNAGQFRTLLNQLTSFKVKNNL